MTTGCLQMEGINRRTHTQLFKSVKSLQLWQTQLCLKRSTLPQQKCKNNKLKNLVVGLRMCGAKVKATQTCRRDLKSDSIVASAQKINAKNSFVTNRCDHQTLAVSGLDLSKPRYWQILLHLGCWLAQNACMPSWWQSPLENFMFRVWKTGSVKYTTPFPSFGIQP